MEEKSVILIVDDTPENLQMLGDMLEQKGYEIQVATDGADALEIARGMPAPDLILLDVMMPGMDGYEVCRHLKADPGTAQIPVIFISALAMPEHKVQAFREGGVDYVTKPFQADEVVARVNTHVELLRKTRELQQSNRELVEANRHLEMFSYSLSHDLRAPLGHIGAFSRLLLEEYGEALPPPALDFVKRITGGCERMEHLIQDLLQFFRSFEQPLVKSHVDTGLLVARVMEELDPEKRPQEVALTIHPLPACFADEQLLRQVFQNLIGNALKYSARAAQPCIEIGTCDSNGETAFFVRDNGVGFDMRAAERLFNAFQRLHTYEDFPGTGIGLCLVHNIIARHGGRVWAESTPGEGATFFFTL